MGTCIDKLPVMDLQRFAGEKTERATPKKRREARDKGQVFKSMDLSSAVILLAIFSGIRFLGAGIGRSMQMIYVRFLSSGADLEEVFTPAGIHALSIETALQFFSVVGPLLLIVLLAGLAINYFQVGVLFSSKAMEFKLSRLNPLEGLKKMFSLKGFVQLIKSILKMVIIGYTVYGVFMKRLPAMPVLMEQDIAISVLFISEGILDIAFKAGMALAVLGVLDYVYQWWEHEKDLRMTKQEVKDEYKQTEGDPQIRSRIREKQRQIGMQRMMQQVPLADVVITNPTHFAVALSYKDSLEKAPMVLAKGKDYVAIKIRQKALEHQVQIVENAPVARALFTSSEIGEEIPFALYQAVAEILAYVYRIKKA